MMVVDSEKEEQNEIVMPNLMISLAFTFLASEVIISVSWARNVKGFPIETRNSISSYKVVVCYSLCEKYRRKISLNCCIYIIILRSYFCYHSQKNNNIEILFIDTTLGSFSN